MSLAQKRRNSSTDFGASIFLTDFRAHRLLVDHARARGYEKRGGGLKKAALDEGVAVTPELALNVLALDSALEKLATV